MRAIRRFRVQPVLPEPLRGLDRVARNLRWSWDLDSQELFRAVDPDLWESCGHDPLRLLSQTSPERLAALATDRRFIRNLELVQADLDEYLNGERWFQSYARDEPAAPRGIAYFSAEFGVSSVLPQYSGGLGILAGDHLKSASDLGIPLIGIGLLYHRGYFRQSLSADGWQQERYPIVDPNELPVSRVTEAGQPVQISVQIAGRPVRAQVWVAQVGRVPLLLLDTNIEANEEAERAVTDRLYGGGADHRLAQEVLLGVGGIRALREYCRINALPVPDVYHANEGHAGFLGLERIREYMASGDDYATALERTRAGNVFTTHTPVPAGIDRFTIEQVRAQFADFAPLDLEEIVALGAETYSGGEPDRFNMAVMGLRLGQRANGVSRLHGQVSREMFGGLWPGFDDSEVPITSVTNGVHQQTWIHPELLELLESRTDESPNVLDGLDWSALDRVDDNTLWTLKRQMRGEMIAMARERLIASCQSRGIPSDWAASALNPHTLTIGFARRGATYKRLTLMLSQPERLKALLNDPQRPVQFVIAGKSHPADDAGKELIQEMVQFADQDDVRGKLVFLPDYDISMARPLYPGCDVWLNNPLRPYEACGTSGMKAALNCAANLSIRDGWWDEWYDPAYGWEIPSAEAASDPEERDAKEAEALYEIIEREIVPKFYNRDANGLPRAWLAMMRATVAGLGPKVLATRMVREYTISMYTPAAAASRQLSVGRTASTLAQWKTNVRASWPQISVRAAHAELPDPVTLGSANTFTAAVHLDHLSPQDLSVQLVFGEVDSEDELHNIEITELTPTGELLADGAMVFRGTKTSRTPGAVGYTVRVVPKNPILASPAEMGLAAVASEVSDIDARETGAEEPH